MQKNLKQVNTGIKYLVFPNLMGLLNYLLIDN